ncbi:MAG: preprotein translocase subunit SecG [Clostridia bacterium]|nr:preprotein translocase subunit SecG [Clostridia bacterium]
MLNNMLLGATMADWFATLVPVIKSVLIGLITLSAICIIVIVLKMDSTGEGAAANSITGQQGIQDSFYQKNKASSKEGRLKNLIIICSTLIAVLTILYFVFTAIIENFA